MGAAFCCGTSAVLRVDALIAAGRMATETLTEDVLTTFKLEEYGYRTIFLDKMLSMGLAPEGLKEYVAPRRALAGHFRLPIADARLPNGQCQKRCWLR